MGGLHKALAIGALSYDHRSIEILAVSQSRSSGRSGTSVYKHSHWYIEVYGINMSVPYSLF
jgi:hypothetical protein